jgi:hypothetical protein
MAGPHSAAALALIMQRFPYLTNEQALYTMFTTGRQNNTINDAAGVAVPNPMRGQMVQTPDRRNGWHTPNLRDAFKGPGQLLGPSDIDTQGYSDVWSNDISDVAIGARRQEDADESGRLGGDEGRQGLDQRPSSRRERHRQVGLRHRHPPRAGTQCARVRRQPHETRPRNPVPHRQRHLARREHGLRRQAVGRRLARELAPGNVLNVGGDVSVAREGRVAVTIRSDNDYTSVQAAGDLVLDGRLTLDVQGALTPGTVLTIMRGKSIEGNFHAMPEKRVVNTGGYLFRVSYKHASVTLTVKHAVPARP